MRSTASLLQISPSSIAAPHVHDEERSGRLSPIIDIPVLHDACCGYYYATRGVACDVCEERLYAREAQILGEAFIQFFVELYCLKGCDRSRIVSTHLCTGC
ncbi:hypothetical protein BU23DRAFT_219077 [Bimuria novae-zelandiae CBS 107.79]|uniref:Uncharacterized protein n=1 Tax=Bimuria novae-zelandiae CBS 107.79 TaxID=1447943 RepID=A0A6A5V9N0_9PLEO|nr:hypothetical protein BU23DRAFT_219077 [Bimuria novae-zelandiae CBS 107.79]